MAIDPPTIGLASSRLSCKLNIHCSLGPSRSILAFLADEDDPHAVPRGNPASLTGANDHLVDRDLQDLAATLRGHGVPGFLAEAVVQQERKVELRRRPELLQGLQQRIALGRQAGHHVIPPRGVLGGGVLAPNEAGFFEVKDAASNSFQAGLEDGSFALAFGHCQLTPAFGDGIQDRVTRLHGGKSAEELAPDLCLSLGTVDVGACFATPSFGRTDAAVGSVAWSCGIGDPHHPKRAGFASGKPTKLVLAWTAAAGPVPDPTRIRAMANYGRPLDQECDNGAAARVAAVEVLLAEDDAASSMLNSIQHLADVPHASPGQPGEFRDDQRLDLTVDHNPDCPLQIREPDVFLTAGAIAIVERIAWLDLQAVPGGRLVVDASVDLFAVLVAGQRHHRVAPEACRPSLRRMVVPSRHDVPFWGYRYP